MADVEEAQQVVDISLKKIVAWRNDNKRVAGSELRRNLLLASVLLKAHRACSENALAHLDDPMTSASLTTSSDDDAGCDVTATEDASSFSAAARTIPDADPVQDPDVVPDQALEEEWEFFGADNEESPDGGRAEKKAKNIEETSANVIIKDSLNFVDSLSRKRKLEIDESENGFDSKRHRTESAALTCETLCFDLEDLMMSSTEDDNCSCSVQSLDMSTSTVAASAFESFGQSSRLSGKNCFDDFDYSADFLSLSR